VPSWPASHWVIRLELHAMAEPEGVSSISSQARRLAIPFHCPFRTSGRDLRSQPPPSGSAMTPNRADRPKDEPGRNSTLITYGRG
jgi:hypothetical protein